MEIWLLKCLSNFQRMQIYTWVLDQVENKFITLKLTWKKKKTWL